MSDDLDTLKEKVKKLSGRATAKKMDLHDLSEELPVNWENILTVAQETYDAYRDLTEARAALKAAGG
ncbi:CCE_0567 family metalloprotein [Novispirillum sp. DQ9]|uniref:CCE_0567 family metalloprotein n=1 Tax=Novispirillum sp. DQ9 TaxID=3398612 RepID=UPI003C7A3044